MKKTNGLKALSLGFTATALLSTNFAKASVAESQLVTVQKGVEISKTIQKEGHEITVMSESVAQQAIDSGKYLSVDSAKIKKILAAKSRDDGPIKKFLKKLFKRKKKVKEEAAQSLVISMPIGLIGQENIFGGVITKVSDGENEELGGLKLTDLTPLHGRTYVTGISQNEPAVTFFGCVENCDESNAESEPLISFPIIGIDEKKQQVILDLAPLGRELDLVSMLDPKGEYTQLKAIASATTAVDYSLSTLVFDVKTTMIPLKANPTDPTAKKTEFVVRWYLKNASETTYSFSSRTPTPEVGFFQTERGATTKIMRFAQTSPMNTDGPVQYYIKNVPTEYRKSFEDAIKSWNVQFKNVIGRELLSYTFVEKTDPMHAKLTPGDIRYNIIEWDLDNKAGYGGLGPSIANQYSGQTMSANVLIQGPTIVSLYTEWFKVNQQADALIAKGKEKEAEILLKEFNAKSQKEIKERKKMKYSLKLGKLAFNVRSQGHDLEDPIAKGTFERIPQGYTYEKYMYGYLLEMVAHELGHNLGLRHNFRGNLINTDNSGQSGTVSNSIMEYLGREYRYINTIQAYDVMAISYGYAGVKPTKKNWFCTDDHVAYEDAEVALASAECSKMDATNDPFSYFEARLARGIDMLVNRKTTAAPVWKLEEMSQVSDAVSGLTSYAASADKTAASWSNFFGKEGRPATKDEVKPYVLARIKKQLCDKSIDDVIAIKDSAEARDAVTANMKALKDAVAKKAKSLNIYTAQDLDCSL